MNQMERLKFKGKLFGLLEDKLGVVLQSEHSKPWVERLILEFENLGDTKDLTKWLKERIVEEFKAVDKFPVWAMEDGPWAFFDGQPMVFIRQIVVPDTPVANQELTPGHVLYVFGKGVKEPGTDGYSMKYEIVTQHPAFRGLVARENPDGSFDIVKKSKK